MVVSEHKRFMQQLEEFQEENGIEVGTPLFAKKPVDQFKLWCAVQEVGGHSEVMATKGWARIGRMFDPPKTMTDLSFRIKKIYETHVLPFEKAMLRGEIKDVYMPPRIYLPAPASTEKRATRPPKRASAPPMANTRPKRIKKEAAAAATRDHDDLVGKRIRVLWPEEKQFFSGTVTAFEKDTGMHRIDYDDGDDEMLDLEAQTWRLISPHDDEDLIDDGGLDQLHSAAKALGDDEEGGAADDEMAGKSQDQASTSDGCISAGHGFRVYRNKEGTGYEVFCLVPGLQLEDLSVKCWNSGRLLVSQTPRETDSNEKWGVVPLKHKIRLPRPVEAASARALVTLHGQLYISVACQKAIAKPGLGTGLPPQPSKTQEAQEAKSTGEAQAPDQSAPAESTAPLPQTSPEPQQAVDIDTGAQAEKATNEDIEHKEEGKGAEAAAADRRQEGTEKAAAGKEPGIDPQRLQ